MHCSINTTIAMTLILTGLLFGVAYGAEIKPKNAALKLTELKKFQYKNELYKSYEQRMEENLDDCGFFDDRLRFL